MFEQMKLLKPMEFDEDVKKVTLANKMGAFVVVMVVSAVFWIPAILATMDEYAIQEHAVVATNKALVKEIHYHGSRGFGRGTDFGIEYTTNTGERIETHLAVRDAFVFVGDTIKIKYVSGNPTHAYPVDYQPRYYKTMQSGGVFLVTALICAFLLCRGWRGQNQAAAANIAKREANAQRKTDADAGPQARQIVADQRPVTTHPKRRIKYKKKRR